MATKTQAKSLHEKLIKIQTEFKAAKTRKNKFGGYMYRSAEDILEAVKPFEESLGVLVTVNEELISTDGGIPIIQSTASITDGVDSIQATAIVGVDLGQKGMATAQQFGSSSSYGKKYALGNLFLIDDTADADATNDHGKAPKAVSKKIEKSAISEEALNKAIDYVKNGGDIDAIKRKYDLNTKQMAKLTEAALDRKSEGANV